ncbi:MAG TPA: TetR family transcriptional regulator [Galbitalea sp.]|jgi:AcrR family transcriptional regulator|nr:TetR family transcriptional regulator [Galbitalea sp.]
MSISGFERARSDEAKTLRERSILDAARRLGEARGIREITLTDIATAIGMHKSALLRYFETREQIFLRLTAAEWERWSAELQTALATEDAATPMSIARDFARTLTARPLFCDLLAQTPLNLERNVSMDSVRSFKLVTHREVDTIIAKLRELLPRLTEEQDLDVIATATSMAGAQWQMANPGREAAALYRSDPLLAHAIVDLEPRLARVLRALIEGFLTE